MGSVLYRERDFGDDGYCLMVSPRACKAVVVFRSVGCDDVSLSTSEWYLSVDEMAVVQGDVVALVSLSEGASKKGEVRVLDEDGCEIIHSVIPRPRVLRLALRLYEGEDVLSELGRLYRYEYPKWLGKFTSETKYAFDFELSTGIMSQLCRFDDVFAGWMDGTEDKYFRNMMIGESTFWITSRAELEEKLETFNSHEYLPSVTFDEVRAEYLDAVEDCDESVTCPKDFGFE